VRIDDDKGNLVGYVCGMRLPNGPHRVDEKARMEAFAAGVLRSVSGLLERRPLPRLLRFPTTPPKKFRQIRRRLRSGPK
jgi:hypothetical protein